MSSVKQLNGICLAVLIAFPVVLAGQAPARPPSAGQAPPVPSAPALCGGQPHCIDTPSFAATVTAFQAILQSGTTKTLTVRLSLRNKLNRPLILGYVANSGVATDDQGNRYIIGNDRAIQGIGQIVGASADSKFVLQPGEQGDARLEFTWNAAPQQIFGVLFQVELAIREVDPLPGNQTRLGREYALRFSRLGDDTAAAGPTPSATAAPGRSAAAAPPSPAPVVDACGGRPRCYGAGPFAAEVTGMTVALKGNPAAEVLQASVRFQNLTTQPVILGFVAGTLGVTESAGMRYGVQVNRTGDGATGMGTVTRAEADPQFVLAPGASATATFTVSRFVGGSKPVDVRRSTFNLDLTVAQLEILPSQQIRSLREHPVTFSNLTADGSGALNRLLQGGR